MKNEISAYVQAPYVTVEIFLYLRSFRNVNVSIIIQEIVLMKEDLWSV